MSTPYSSSPGAKATQAYVSAPPAPIPHGVADYFWTEAADRLRLADTMLALFRSWGYGDVILPAFEYDSTLARSASAEFQRELYRFTDRDGSALVLRADMTIALARLVATRLHDVPMPQRFCYADSVFRYARTQAGRQREFFQSGIELIGASSPAADAEVLALAAHAMYAAGITNTRIAVGHLGYFNALMQELALAPEVAALLIRAIDSNSDAELAGFLQQTDLPDTQRRTVAELAHLSSVNPAVVLERARAIALNDGMHAALNNLAAILNAIESHSLANSLFLDLTEIHNLGYYTGITFEVLAPGLGFPVASGGRYDNLVGLFGEPQPAVGAAFLIDSILLARRMGGSVSEARPLYPHAVVRTQGDPAAQWIVNQWRLNGARIAVAFDDAPASHADSLLHLDWNGGIFMQRDPSGTTLLSAEQAWELVLQAIVAESEAPA